MLKQLYDNTVLLRQTWPWVEREMWKYWFQIDNDGTHCTVLLWNKCKLFTYKKESYNYITTSQWCKFWDQTFFFFRKKHIAIIFYSLPRTEPLLCKYYYRCCELVWEILCLFGNTHNLCIMFFSIYERGEFWSIAFQFEVCISSQIKSMWMYWNQHKSNKIK